MNGPIFWRIVWKEYRLQRGFWIAMAVLTVMLQLLVLWSVDKPDQRIVTLFGVALGVSAFYALGCGATLFATEHETGTYAFQRALPVSPWWLFVGKVVPAGVGVVTMIAAMWTAAAWLAGWELPRVQAHGDLWAMWGMAAAEGLAWGIFFSLLLKRPLMAAVLGGLTAAWFAYGAASIMAMGGALPMRIAIVMVVVAMDVWLGNRWFRGSILPIVDAEERDAFPTRWQTAHGRLFWQQWRQSARLIGVFSAIAAFLLLAGAWAVLAEREHGVRSSSDAGLVFMVAGLMLAPVVGSCVFLADQRRRSFRFFADRGVSPTSVWLSRHMVWMPVMAGWACVTALVVWQLEGDVEPAGMILGYAAITYASGQIASMFLRSSVLAAVCGLILTAPVCWWAMLMQMAGVSWLWSVAPIPLIFLGATWLRTRDWLRERNTIRARLRATVSVAVPLAAIATAVCFFRAYEIPYVAVDLSTENFSRPRTPEEQVTFDLYQEAWDGYVAMEPEPVEEGNDVGEEADPEGAIPGIPTKLAERELAWVQANQKTIPIVIAASERTECDLFNRNDYWSENYLEIGKLGSLLVASARKLTAEGELDAALDHFLAATRVSIHLRHSSRDITHLIADRVEKEVRSHLTVWAARPDQTPERITAAMAQLDKLTDEPPSRTEVIRCNYYLSRRMLEGDLAMWGNVGIDEDTATWWQRYFTWMPWERARAVRLINHIVDHDLRQIHDLEERVSQGEPTYEPSGYFSDEISQWWDTTPWAPHFFFLYLQYRQGENVARMAAVRRATRVTLAIEAWKAEHGELPDSLDVLLGKYLDKLPMDPYVGEPIKYFPKGTSTSIIAETSGAMYYLWERLEPGTPLLWVIGPNVKLSHPDADLLQRYKIVSENDTLRSPESEDELLKAGWPFPIP